MEPSGRKLPTILMFMLLLMSAGMGLSEARMCEYMSHRYQGRCMRSSYCASVCHNEGYRGGYCKGYGCYCTSPC